MRLIWCHDHKVLWNLLNQRCRTLDCRKFWQKRFHNYDYSTCDWLLVSKYQYKIAFFNRKIFNTFRRTKPLFTTWAVTHSQKNQTLPLSSSSSVSWILFFGSSMEILTRSCLFRTRSCSMAWLRRWVAPKILPEFDFFALNLINPEVGHNYETIVS